MFCLDFSTPDIRLCLAACSARDSMRRCSGAMHVRTPQVATTKSFLVSLLPSSWSNTLRADFLRRSTITLG